MAKQGSTQSVELQQLQQSSSSTASISEFSLSRKPRVMKLDLITLPQFNVTYIARCLTVSERLTIMTHIHPRFREFMFQPQCFPDMSFFPVSDESMHSPKILSSNGHCGITYVEINIFSKHEFISRVALLAGMWNFKADLWNRIDWPHTVNIESLQLTLDYTSSVASVHLDGPPRLQFDLDAPANDSDEQRDQVPEQKEDQDQHQDQEEEEQQQQDEVDEIEEALKNLAVDDPSLPTTPGRDGDADNELKLDLTVTTSTSSGGESETSESEMGDGILECISPTTRKPIDLKCRLRNLFFIRFDSSGHQPVIYFPKTLWGLGLQSFSSSLFTQSWWTQQIQIEQRLENLRFLVLSCCEFQDNELQVLLNSTKNVEHLSLRYVKWEGTVYFPKSLLSLGYFPDRNFEGFYDFKYCDRIWQISTRFNENESESANFLNACSRLLCINRVKFEFVRREQFAERDIDFRGLRKWEQCADNDTFTVAISEEDLAHYVILKEIFPIANDKFLTLDQVKFEDCPLWSDESNDFIHMTNKRKLLLR